MGPLPHTQTHTHTHTPSARPVRPRFQILGVGGAGVCSSLRHTRVHTAQPRFRGPLPLSTAPALPPRSPCAMLSSPAPPHLPQASQTLPYSTRSGPDLHQIALQNHHFCALIRCTCIQPVCGFLVFVSARSCPRAPYHPRTIGVGPHPHPNTHTPRTACEAETPNSGCGGGAPCT